MDILNAMEALSKGGAAPKWGAGLGQIDRRNVFLGELSRVGIRKSDIIGKPSVRNDAAFLYTLVGVTSVMAVAAGQLPGDWVSTHRLHSLVPAPQPVVSACRYMMHPHITLFMMGTL